MTIMACYLMVLLDVFYNLTMSFALAMHGAQLFCTLIIQPDSGISLTGG
jgi:hypothetical protein